MNKKKPSTEEKHRKRRNKDTIILLLLFFFFFSPSFGRSRFSRPLKNDGLNEITRFAPSNDGDLVSFAWNAFKLFTLFFEFSLLLFNSGKWATIKTRKMRKNLHQFFFLCAEKKTSEFIFISLSVARPNSCDLWWSQIVFSCRTNPKKKWNVECHWHNSANNASEKSTQSPRMTRTHFISLSLRLK